MLVLARRVGEKIVVHGTVTLTVLEVSGRRVRLGFDAPQEIPIRRQEQVRNAKKAAGVLPAQGTAGRIPEDGSDSPRSANSRPR